MTFLIVVTVLLILGIVGCRVFNDLSSGFNLASALLTLVASVVLVISLVILVVNHYSAESKIVGYERTKLTIEESRNNSELSDVERASIVKTIMSINNNISSYKYWNETSFDIFIPDELAKLEYLK